MKKLDRAVMQRIKAVANEQVRADFVARKKELTIECLRLQAAGEDIGAYLEQQYLIAVRDGMKARFPTSRAKVTP